MRTILGFALALVLVGCHREPEVVEDAEGQPWDGTEQPGPALIHAADMADGLPQGVYTVRRFFGFEASVLIDDQR